MEELTQYTEALSVQPGAVSPANTDEKVSSAAEALLDTEDPFRIGAPGPLLPFPLDDLVVTSEDAITDVWPLVRLEVLELLHLRSISWYTMSVYKRHLRGTPEKSAIPTVVIVTSRSEPKESWKLFLRDAWALFLRLGLDWLHIELLAPIATGGKMAFPINSSEPVVSRWSALRRRILGELGGEDWFCMQVVRKGYHETDCKVTVLISVRDMFDAKWMEIRNHIREILRHEAPEMGVDIIQGAEITPWPTPKPTELPTSSFTEKVGISASIGSGNGSGRLGGYVSLSRPGITAESFGLTSYGVLQAGGLSAVHNAQGVKNAAIEGINVEFKSPSQIDVDHSVFKQQAWAQLYDSDLERSEQESSNISPNHLESRIRDMTIAKAERDEFVQDANTMKIFDNTFGKFFSGSGVRKEGDGYPLNWALIQPKAARVDWNTVNLLHQKPTSGRVDIFGFQTPMFHFRPTPPGFWTPKTYTIERVDTSCLQPPDPPQHVFKKGPLSIGRGTDEWKTSVQNGRSTGSSWGAVNAINADIHILGEGELQNMHYSAVDIVPSINPLHDFYEPGDAGSWVFSQDGSLCGMLFGGTNPMLGQGAGRSHGLVVPIDRVFADVEKMTGSKVSLPDC